MKTEVYLIRHGQTEWNKTGRFQGSTDVPLDEVGVYQANLLKERFASQFDLIYASPLSRAAKTANIICEGNLPLTPIIQNDLREIDFGHWEGLNFEEIKNTHPEEFHKWYNDAEFGYLPSKEGSLKSARERIKNLILETVKVHPGKRIAFIAHGGILKTGIIGIFDWKIDMYHKFFLANTSVTKVIFRENLHPILTALNDTGHLLNQQ